jgi:hypothetical protein
VSHLGCRRHCMRSGSLGSNQCQGRKVLPKQIRQGVAAHRALPKQSERLERAGTPLSAKDDTFDMGKALAYCHCTVCRTFPKLRSGER